MGTPEKYNRPFLRAIPLDQIERAAKLPGTGYKMFVYLWYLSGVSKKSKDLQVSYKKAGMFGLNGRGVSRGLQILENEGIVETTRGRGKSPRVTFLIDPN